MRRTARWALTGVVFLGLAVLLIRTDLTGVFIQLGQISWWLLGALVFMQGMTIILVAVQWKLLAWHLGLSVRSRDVFVMNMGGTLLESVTPAVKTGGEIYKVYHLHRHAGLDKRVAVGLVAVQKTVSITCFITVLWVALLVVFGRGLGIGGDLLRLAGLLTIGLIIFVVVAMLVLRQYMRRQGAQLASLRGMLHAMRRQKLVWLVHGVLGLVVWGLYALKAHVVFLGLLGQGSLVLAFVVTMSAYAVALLPVSPGGLGTFEATFVSVSSPFGVSVEGALAVVVLLRLVTFWLSLAVSAVTVGWIVFIKRRHHTTASGFSG